MRGEQQPRGGAVGGHGAGGGGGAGPPEVEGGASGADDSDRVSPAQLAFIDQLKKTIDKNIVHHAGGVKAPKGGSGVFPFDSLFITPKCAAMQKITGMYRQ